MNSLLKDFKSNRPLLIQPAIASAFLNRVKSIPAISSGAQLNEMDGMLKMMFGEAESYEKFPPFAVIPIHGVIGKGLTDLEKLCGCVDVDAVEEMLEDAEKDSTISTIILNVNSPGGCSIGVPELALRIKNSKKEIISFTDSEACSAAYWLASQAKKFYATPSSTVGSVGVYIAYEDESKAYADAGIKIDVIKAGTFKGAGIPGTSLDANQRKMLQDEVLEVFEDFKAAVKSVREFVQDDSMEGQTFSGRKAAEAGLITGLVNGFDEMMVELNAEVAAQMEADEENDKRHGEELVSEELAEEAKQSAGARALAGLDLSPKASAGSKAEEEDEDENEDEDGVSAQPTEAGKLPVKMSQKDDDDEDEDEDGEEAEAETEADADSEAEADAEAKKGHHVVVSDYMETIKRHDDAESEEANDSVLRHLKKMNKSGRKIHVVSGRPESKRSEISDFLAKHKVEHHALHLKPEDDKRSTPEYKVETLKKLESEGHKISHCVENDAECSEAYEEAGWHTVHPDTVERMDAESEDEDAVETDEKHNKKKLPRHKSRGVS